MSPCAEAKSYKYISRLFAAGLTIKYTECTLSVHDDAEPARRVLGILVVCFLERRAGVIYGGYFCNNGLIRAAFFITSQAGWLMIGLGFVNERVELD